MLKELEALLACIFQQPTVEQGVQTLVTGIATQAEGKNATQPADEMLNAVVSNIVPVTAAILANTPAASTASPAVAEAINAGLAATAG